MYRDAESSLISRISYLEGGTEGIFFIRAFLIPRLNESKNYHGPLFVQGELMTHG